MQRGLSLVELVLVIAVMAILAAGAFINISQGIAKSELYSVAEVLAADIRWLQQISINSASIEEKVVWIPVLVMKQTAPFGHMVIGEKSAVIRSYEYPATVINSSNMHQLSFKTNGRPASGSDFTFILKSTRDKNISVKVIVEMITGRVRIE